MKRQEEIPEEIPEEIRDYPLVELLNKMSKPFLNEHPMQWDTWAVFIDDLPIVFNIKECVNNDFLLIPYDVWCKRHTGPYYAQRRLPKPNSTMYTAYITPSRELLNLPKSRGFHSAVLLIRTEEKNRRFVLAFLRTKPEIIANHDKLLIKNEMTNKRGRIASYIQYFCLWETETIPGESLIEKYKRLNNEDDQYNKITAAVNRIFHQDSGEYSFGELIKVQLPPLERESIPGFVVCDTSLFECDPDFPMVLFLRLVNYKKSHESEDDKNHIVLPDDYKFGPKKDKQSIAVPLLRFCPKKYVSRWNDDKPVEAPEAIKSSIRKALEVYLE